MPLANCKVSGAPAVLQTRQEFHAAYVAANPNAKPPEIVRPGDIAGTDTAGNRMLVRDADVNVDDVRIICPASGRHTGWDRPDGVERVTAAWNEMNPAG